MEFLELHQKKVVYLIFSLEQIIIHTWVPAEAVWQSMTNHTDSTGRFQFRIPPFRTKFERDVEEFEEHWG